MRGIILLQPPSLAPSSAPSPSSSTAAAAAGMAFEGQNPLPTPAELRSCEPGKVCHVNFYLFATQSGKLVPGPGPVLHENSSTVEVRGECKLLYPTEQKN